MKLFGNDLLFNNKKVYYENDKPTANDIEFTDGLTFQQKLDNGTLKGPKGDTGKDGLTTSIKVNGTTYTHINGAIILPDYPNSVDKAYVDAQLAKKADIEHVNTIINSLTSRIEALENYGKVPVTGITLNKTSHTFEINETLQLTATISPSNATNKSVTWTSSNSNIAIVNSNGLVTAKAAGSCTITATTVDGNKVATCSTMVNEAKVPVTSVGLEPTRHTFYEKDETLQLTATIFPYNATNKNVTWSSSNVNIATVSNNGLVTAKTNGNCTITVTTSDGNKTATCSIIVNHEVETYEFDIVSKTYRGARNTIVDIEGICTYPNIDYWEISSSNGWIGVANAFTNGKFKLELPDFLGNGTYSNCVMEAKRNKLEGEQYDTIVATAPSKFTLIVEDVVQPPPTDILVTSITLNKTNHTFTSYATEQLTTTIAPTNATNKNVTWTSSNTNIATVSTNGLVTAKANGSTTITCRSTDGSNKSATCNITVNVNTSVSVTSVSLNKTSHTFTSLNTTQLTATVSPSNATNKNVTWSSTNSSVATVSNTGLVTAKTNGSCTIEVITQDGNKKATCSIVVNVASAPITGINILEQSYKFTSLTTKQLALQLSPPTASASDVIWASTKASVASVNSDGVVTAKANGSCTVSARNSAGTISDTCAITVEVGSTGNVPVTGISISDSFYGFDRLTTKQLTATVAPSNATNKNVTWSSTNSSVATVNSTGLVTAKTNGSCTIEAVSQDGSKKATCSIIVDVAVTPPTPGGLVEGKMYRSIAFIPYPHEDGYGAWDGIDQFKNYNYGTALICLPVDCNFKNNAPFCDVRENLINSICNKLENMGIQPILKMHTVSLQEDGQGNIEKPVNAQTWFANYRTLVNTFADIVVKRGYKEFIISNEMHNVMNLASNRNYMLPIINDVKAKGLKVSMSMNTPEVVENDGFQYFNELDFYCMNTYPSLTHNQYSNEWARNNFTTLRNGFYTVENSLDIDYANLFKNMGGANNSHKEIWLTEVGANTSNKTLEYPAYWGDSTDPKTNYEGQKHWLKAVFDVLEKDRQVGKLPNRVSRYMLWDGNFGSNFNPIGKMSQEVLDTYWKDGGSGTVNVTGVSLNKTSHTFKNANETLQLTATITPSTATNKNVTWKSSNTNVATVNSNGLVTAKANGSTTITVTTQDGNKTATCNIIVDISVVPPTPGEVNYFEINNTLMEDKECTYSVNTTNNTITVTSDRNVHKYYGYLIWDISKIREGRRYKLTCKSSNDMSFIRFRVDTKEIKVDALKKEYSIEFTGVNAQEKLVDICFGIRHPQNENIGSITTTFSDIKIIDLDGEPGPLPESAIKYDIVDYKIIVKQNGITESYHSCEDIPRNLNGNGGVDGYKLIIKDRIKHYLSLTNSPTSSRITIDGMKPFNYTYIDQAWKSKWLGVGYSVYHNSLKFTIANRVDKGEWGNVEDRTINPVALERGIKIFNCALPGYMEVKQDQNSPNSISEGYFDTEWLGVCRLNHYKGEKFHIHQNIKLLGGFGNSTRFYVSVLVHELGHVTGIPDNSPHYPTSYLYNKEDREPEWLQPSDIAHIQDKFPHLTGRSTKMPKDFYECASDSEDTKNVLFSFIDYENEDDMLEKANTAIIAKFINKEEKGLNIYNLDYVLYNFEITKVIKGDRQVKEIIQIKEHESFDLNLEIGSEYKLYLADYEKTQSCLLNPKNAIIKL